ncbi:site-specific integrase [Clostridium tetani]|uniref:Site-specific integrase n=1 Tax=Clostridium tetani TaxID=1513 RepID=A0ABC8EFV5_CLOTA|nr:site-specific integrase [Clostridium tetani]RXI58976.1 site-specific integrase [Clostridium tetani]BDR82544.1 site-specific integrase [Clostridium tetani]
MIVEPIRDVNIIHDILGYLKKNNERNYILFLMGIYTGLRISDILQLKIRDVKGKDYINLKEKKTDKLKRLEINPVLRKELQKYCEHKDPDDFLIKSRERYNKPISREMAYKILRDIGDKFNIPNLGTHSMRKTFGYLFYQQTKDVVMLQEIFNHSDPSITLHYIGVKQESINEAIRNFRI